MIILYSVVGAFVRSLFGMYKSYGKVRIFRLNVRKVAVEFCVSVIIGTFGVIILNGLNALPIEISLAALIGGLTGADILNLITKKIGLAKGLNVMNVSDEDVQLLEFNDRQVNALRYLSKNEKITSPIYQKLNQVDQNAAKYDLIQLVMKGKLEKMGKGRATYYILS